MTKQADEVIAYLIDWDFDKDINNILYKLVENMTADDLAKIYFDDEVFYEATNDTKYLDVEKDYPGVEKHYPVIGFATNNGREVVNPRGFAKHCLAELGITDIDLSDVDTQGDGSTGVSFTYKDLGWTWIDEGATSPTADVIHYTFGGALGHNNHPLVPFVVGTADAY